MNFRGLDMELVQNMTPKYSMAIEAGVCKQLPQGRYLESNPHLHVLDQMYYQQTTMLHPGSISDIVKFQILFQGIVS